MRRLMVLLFLIVAVVGSSGCSTAAPTPSPSPTPAPTPTPTPTPTAAPTLSFVPKPGDWLVSIPVSEGSSSFTALITLKVEPNGANLDPNSLVGSTVSIGTATPIVDGSFKWSFTVGSQTFTLKGTFVSPSKVTGTWNWSKSTGTWEASPKA